MTAKPVYNPIESVSTLASVIHDIKQAYWERRRKVSTWYHFLPISCNF